MQVTVPVVDLENLIEGLARFGEKIIGIAADAALHEAEYQFPMTQARVPIQTGQLQLSGRVEGPDVDAETLTAGIAYGGPAGAGDNTEDVEYALRIHEDLEMHHVIGQAKFVESVVREQEANGGALNRMGAEIVEKLGI